MVGRASRNSGNSSHLAGASEINRLARSENQVRNTKALPVGARAKILSTGAEQYVGAGDPLPLATSPRQRGSGARSLIVAGRLTSAAVGSGRDCSLKKTIWRRSMGWRGWGKNGRDRPTVDCPAKIFQNFFHPAFNHAHAT